MFLTQKVTNCARSSNKLKSIGKLCQIEVCSPPIIYNLRVTSENSRKQAEVFWCSQGGIWRKHWPEIAYDLYIDVTNKGISLHLLYLQNTSKWNSWEPAPPAPSKKSLKSAISLFRDKNVSASPLLWKLLGFQFQIFCHESPIYERSESTWVTNWKDCILHTSSFN